MNIRTRVIVPLCAIAVAGCSSVTSPEVAGASLKRWESHLVFTAEAPSEAQTGTSVVVRATLRNDGGETIDACLRGQGQYTLWGTANLRQELSIVDHRSCEQRITLKPSEAMSWPLTVQVSPAVGLGAARIFALVDLIYGRGCHPLYGCYHASLRSQPAQVLISAAPVNGA